MELNSKVQKYKELKSLISDMEKELETLAEEFKAMGSFDTEQYAVKISEQSREFLKGIKDVAAVFGRENLEKNNLIGTTTYQTIRVSEKKQQAA